MHRSFAAEQIDDILQFVTTNVEYGVVLSKQGHRVKVPKTLPDEEKVKIVRSFCAHSTSKICVVVPSLMRKRDEGLGAHLQSVSDGC